MKTPQNYHFQCPCPCNELQPSPPPPRQTLQYWQVSLAQLIMRSLLFSWVLVRMRPCACLPIMEFLFPLVLWEKLCPSTSLQDPSVSWKGVCALVWCPVFYSCHPFIPWFCLTSRAFVHGSHGTVTNRKGVLNQPYPGHSGRGSSEKQKQSFGERGLLVYLHSCGLRSRLLIKFTSSG